MQIDLSEYKLTSQHVGVKSGCKIYENSKSKILVNSVFSYAKGESLTATIKDKVTGNSVKVGLEV